MACRIRTDSYVFHSEQYGQPGKGGIESTQAVAVIIKGFLFRRSDGKNIQQVRRRLVRAAVTGDKPACLRYELHAEFRARLLAAAGQQVSFQVRFPEVGKVNIRHSLQQQHQTHFVLCTAYVGRKFATSELTGSKLAVNVTVQQATHLSCRQC